MLPKLANIHLWKEKDVSTVEYLLFASQPSGYTERGKTCKNYSVFENSISSNISVMLSGGTILC